MLFTARATIKVNETSHVISIYFCLFSLLFHSSCSHPVRDSDKRQPIYYFNFLRVMVFNNKLTLTQKLFFAKVILGSKPVQSLKRFTPFYHTIHIGVGETIT